MTEPKFTKEGLSAHGRNVRWNGDPIGVACRHILFDEGEPEANAQLWAAAPDMYEALKELTAEVDGLVEASEKCGDPDCECPMQDAYKPGSTVAIAQRAKAAIAKAEGRS